MDTFAFADPAQPRSIGHSSGRKSQLEQLLREDNKRPANCFSVGWDGKIGEGIFLEEDHPSAAGKTALVLGESGRYIASNTSFGQGCLYEYVGARAIMRRATIDHIHIPNKTNFSVFGRLHGTAAYVLVHVDFGTPSLVKIKTPLWAGVEDHYQRIAWGDTEMLLKLDPNYGTPRIFYADGRVGNFSSDMFGGKELIHFLKEPEDILVARLDLVERKLTETSDISDPNLLVRAVDRWFYELANMLSLSGSSESMRRQIMNTIERLTARYFPSNGVRTKFKDILASFGDRTVYGWLFGKVSTSIDVAPLAAHFNREKPPAGRSSKSEREAKLRDRSIRDQGTRNAMRGSTNGGGQKPGQQGKKGGKKN